MRRPTAAIGEVYLVRGRDRGARRASSAPRSRADYAGREPLLVAPLKSSAVFLADLSRALPIPHEIDFVELAGYGTAASAAAASGCSRTSTGRSTAATSSSSRTSSTPA